MEKQAVQVSPIKKLQWDVQKYKIILIHTHKYTTHTRIHTQSKQQQHSVCVFLGKINMLHRKHSFNF